MSMKNVNQRETFKSKILKTNYKVSHGNVAHMLALIKYYDNNPI